jgi:hypothetical protein
VINADVRAGIFVVDFAVGDYVALALNQEEEERHRLSDAVRRYAAALADADVGRPYRLSASLGTDLSGASNGLFETAPEPAAAFRRTAELLQRTEWFRRARFVRVTRICEGTTGGRDIRLADGHYELVAGSSYELELTHYEPGDVTDRQPFSITTDGDLVQIIGRPGFDVASRYDYVRVFLHTSLPPRGEASDTVLTVQPDATVEGPTIRLPIRVVPPAGDAVKVAAGSALTLFLLGLPAVATDLPPWFKGALLLFGALGASYLQTFGFKLFVPSWTGLTKPDHERTPVTR